MHEPSQRRNVERRNYVRRTQTTTTATMWQDEHSGLRRHKLMTKKLGDTIPALCANENVRDYDSVLAPAKLLSPYTGWRWYITEWQAETGLCFGLVEGFESELGYFSLDELAEATVLGTIPAVERDLFWQPKTLGEIRRGLGGRQPRNAPQVLEGVNDLNSLMCGRCGAIRVGR